MKQCMGCMEIYQDNLTKCPNCGYEEGTIPENTLHMEPGSILNNRYIVGKVLGYGGFGVTYIAWDTLLEQKVAIKEFLPSEFATRMLGRTEVTIFSGDKRKQFMEGLFKFVEEAKKIAKFNNVPGIVKIFDCIEENNTAYIIMEYLEGETLAVKLEREKKMKPEKAINLLLPVMESLKKVNANGIIHRDIAPDNIFVTSKGEPKLIDFGAARYATTSLSRSLTIIIKPGYSPEEQYRSMGDQGSWTDVYSIGATLYKMITGETPVDSMERRANLEQHHTELLKPISKFTQIDKNHETAIMNALNVKVQDRTMNMGQLMEELTGGVEVKRLQVKNEKENILLKLPLKAKIIALVAIAVLLASVGIVTKLLGRETFVAKGMTRVPNIRNLDIDAAIRQLDACNLTYTIVGYTYSTTIPANSVMSQSIEGGKTVKINSEIEITVSKVNNAHEMNNILGMNYENALKVLNDAGYKLEVQRKNYDDVIAEGCVIKQQMDKKTSGKSIQVVVSEGREEPYDTSEYTKAPKLVGVAFKDCLKVCKKNSVMLEVIERKASKDYAEGVIMSQSVEADSDVKKGTVIEIVVSKGTDEIKIDDFSNWKIDKARKYLTEQGLHINAIYEVNTDYDHGIIYGQSPKAGITIKTGETVTLNVSIGPEEFEMVSLYKMTEEEAIHTVESYGLTYEIEKAFSVDVQDGCVYEQSIKKGNKAKVGDKIIIKVCDAGVDITLPKMVGEEVEQIKKKLEEQGIKVIIEKEYDPTIGKGKIISTTPEEGKVLKPGDSVRIVYSGGVGDIEHVADVVNMGYSQAETTLRAQGLNVKYKFDFNLSYAEGVVMKQSIAANEKASTGDQIEITVSKGRKPTVVFENNPLVIKVGDTTQEVAVVEPMGSIVSWDVNNSDIASVSVASSPSIDYDTYTKYYANVTALGEGTTELVIKIRHIDNSESTYTCKLVVD